MIVEIKNYDFHMKVNLEEVCKTCGVRVWIPSYGKGSYSIDYPVSRAKKLFTIFFQECNPDQIKDIDGYIMKCKNEKVKKVWQEVKKKWD